MSEDIHRKVMRTPPQEMVAHLNLELGTTIVTTIADVKDRKLPYKWAKVDGPTPRVDAFRRLQVAYRVWLTIEASDNADIARAWFIGANPLLGENAPIMELRDGNLNGVLDAARAFVQRQ